MIVAMAIKLIPMMSSDIGVDIYFPYCNNHKTKLLNRNQIGIAKKAEIKRPWMQLMFVSAIF